MESVGLISSIAVFKNFSLVCLHLIGINGGIQQIIQTVIAPLIVMDQ